MAFSTAFQTNAFQNNAFQVEVAVEQAGGWLPSKEELARLRRADERFREQEADKRLRLEDDIRRAEFGDPSPEPPPPQVEFPPEVIQPPLPDDSALIEQMQMGALAHARALEEDDTEVLLLAS